MVRLTGLQVAIVVATFAAGSLAASAQTNPTGGQQTQGTTGQQTQGTTQSQGTPGQQNQGTAAGQQTQGQPGSGAQENQRQAALQHLTAARQDLADITKLPAATHLEGQPRNDLNQLISNFNSLITSNGPEWRQAYDKVQANLAALIGPSTTAGSEQGQSAVGTSGTNPPPSLDPAIAAKLSDLRQHIDQFGETVGVKPGQSASAQQNATGGQSTAGTSGTSTNEQAQRDIDQINSIVSRLLSQGAPDQPMVSVSRQDLQQIQQYLTQLRQSVGQQPIR